MKTCSMISSCVPVSRKSDKEAVRQMRKDVQERCGAHATGVVHCCLIRMEVSIGGESNG